MLFRSEKMALGKGHVPHNDYKEEEPVKDDDWEAPDYKQHPLNQILFGPPGTGKTYNSINLAVEIADPGFMSYHKNTQDRALITKRYRELVNEGRIVFTTFHQSMSYEDFIEGIKPFTREDGAISYGVEPGVFKMLCNVAGSSSGKAIFTPLHAKSLSAETSGITAQQFSLLVDAYLETLPVDSETERSSVILYGVRKYPFDVFKNPNRSSIIVRAGDMRTPLVISKNELINVFNGSKQPMYPSYENILVNRIIELKSDDSDLQVEDIPENYNKDRVPHVLIIDEINRGNVSQVFGELITLIEPDKRAGNREALEVTLPYSKEKFSVPSNLYIIGTMNTADRSVEALDTALRRRFSFIEVTPEYSLFEDAYFEDISLKTLLETINKRIEGLLDEDHAIGHSYFLRVTSGETSLKQVFFNEIIPLLQEYFYGNYSRIELVIGKGFVKAIPVQQSDYATPSSDNEEFNDHIRYTLVKEAQMDDLAFLSALRTLMNESDEA